MTSSQPLTIRHILCPVDFSDTSELALTYACNLARHFEARVTALHVYHLMAHVFPDDVLALPAAVEDGLRKDAGRELDAMVERCTGSGLEVERRLCEGVPHDEIARQALELGADLVILGTHGRTGFRHALIGSVAERVVRHCEVPVLTVRKPSA